MAQVPFNQRYELVEKVGEGPMAVTYRARDRVRDRFVAVKLLREPLSADEGFCRALREQIASVACLRSETAAEVYGYEADQSRHYIIREFVEGEDLGRLVRREGRLTAFTAADIAADVAAALAAAHAKGIVHGALAPGNIIVGPDGRPKVTDFGLSRAFAAASLAAPAVSPEAAAYLAPEQAAGRQPDARSDVYSLGVILFEMLTGRKPFSAHGDRTSMSAHVIVSQPSADHAAFGVVIPPALEAIVKRALEKDRSKRYHSAEQMLVDLHRFRRNPRQAQGMPPNRGKRAVRILAVLSVLAAAAIGGAWWYLHRHGISPVQQTMNLFSEPFGGKSRVHILVIGVDSDRDPRRADTMFLATADFASRRASIVSVPRDLRVEIPGHDVQKVNAAYALGGVDLVIRTAESVLGVKVDHYVKITIPALVKLVDRMGGVWIDVEKRMRYRDRSQNLYINLKPGRQLLNGEQAMGYVRFRMDAMGDLARVQRQQKFLKAVAEQVLQPRNLPRLPGLISLFLEAVETDMMAGDLRALVNLAKQIGPQAVRTATIPATPEMIHGISYLEPDWEATRRLVDDVVLGNSPVVEVVNASSLPGAGFEVADRLEEGGFQVRHVFQAEQPRRDCSVIDHYGRRDRAEDVARLIGDARIATHRQEDGVDFTVVIGDDYVERSQKNTHP